MGGREESKTGKREIRGKKEKRGKTEIKVLKGRKLS